MIRGWLVGDDKLVARMNAMPGRVHDSLVRRVTRLLLQLEAKVKGKLSNEVLNVKTGTLRRSITQQLIDAPNQVAGIVGTNVPYARPHEYGFKGVVTVKSHLRSITKAFGKEIKSGSVSFNVRSHSRQVNLPERSFLRSALAEMDPQIKSELAEAVREGLNA
jgi:phage gpG-like protein